MPQQMIWFFVSIAFSLIAWGIVTARYIWPELRLRQRAEGLQPLLVLHSFRRAQRKLARISRDWVARREYLLQRRTAGPGSTPSCWHWSWRLSHLC
jgi:hypothetical protein